MYATKQETESKKRVADDDRTTRIAKADNRVEGDDILRPKVIQSKLQMMREQHA